MDKYSGRTGVLVANHEYTNEDMMFDAAWFEANKEEARKIAMNAHGFSVVEVKRKKNDKKWSVRAGWRAQPPPSPPAPNSWLTARPARQQHAQDRSQTQAATRSWDLNNCAGGTTPWGTVLSGEENFDQYFRGKDRRGIPLRHRHRGNRPWLGRKRPALRPEQRRL